MTTNAVRRRRAPRDFFSALPTAKAVASAASSVCSARTTSSSGDRDRVEEVEADDPLRCSSFDAISVTDSAEVLVASTHSADDRLDLGEHLALDVEISSNTASMTRSESANTS